MRCLDYYIQRTLNSEVRLISSYNFKNKVKDPLKVVLVTPRNHFFTSLNLGQVALYHYVNSSNNIPAIADRAFYYDIIRDGTYKSLEDFRLFGLESKIPLAEADIMGFSFTNPVDFPHYFKMMDFIKLPYRSKEREFPLIIGGGHGFTNPEPMSDFLDLFILGEGALPLEQVIKETYATKKQKFDKKYLLKKLGGTYNIYIPSHFDFNFACDGSVTKIRPNENYSKIPIRHKSPKLVESSILMVDNYAALLLAQGCKNKCYFCQLGRDRFALTSETEIKLLIEKFISAGAKVIGLHAATPTQAPYLENLLEYLSNKNIDVVVGSMLLSDLTDTLLKKLNTVRVISSREYFINRHKKTSINIAPDTTSSYMLKLFNKPFSYDDVLKAIGSISKYSFEEVIMSFIDVGDIISLEQIANILTHSYNLLSNKSEIVAYINPLIPSPNTLAQRLPMLELDIFKEHIDYLKEHFCKNAQERSPKSKFNIEPLPDGYILYECITMRNNRQIGEVLEDLHKHDIDADNLNKDILFKFISEKEYERCCGGYNLEDILPWGHIDYRIPHNKEKVLVSLFNNIVKIK